MARELAYTERAAVTIGPYVSYPGSAAQTIEGFVRVHQDGEPVPEALRVTMGKQGHLMLPCEEAEVAQDGTFIYAGILNPSYGHFITEGVARLWYAREHPELPIIWHSRADALSEMQLTILGILGIRNPHVFVRKPTRYANVVFPLPGAGLGSYFLKEQGEFMGVVEPASMVPGKKIYLSRGRLGGARGISEDDDAIEAMLREQGFTIYQPERHSILE
ncbi:MAG: glycosyltransferase family 61 protein, partial [Comamonadaceae bacterium]